MARKRSTKPQTSTIIRAGDNLWRPAFLAAMAQHGNVTVAAKAAGINRSTAYKAQRDDPEFERQWQAAYDEACDLIEAEALRRASRGTRKGIYYKGVRVDEEIEYSDTLMLAMLKGHKPDKYGDKITIKVKPEWLTVLEEAGVTASDVLENFVQRYHNAKQEVNNDS